MRVPLLAVLLVACTGEPEVEVEVLAACGNGVVEPDEQCDDGDNNSDTGADACRTSCRLPTCGDGAVDADEDCDDGGALGGDGCTPGCEVEDGALDAEPNDAWDQAQSVDPASPIYGGLTEGDVDCFAFEIAECDVASARLTGDCSAPASLSLHDPTGAMVAASALGDDGCAVIDPADEPGARFVTAGTWAVCVRGLLDGAVPGYALSVETGPADGFDIPLSEGDDFDGDGLLDECDGDLDGDGLANGDDNCPDVPNGTEPFSAWPDSSGFIRYWLSAGPFTGESSPDTCLPTETEQTGDDANAAPAVGDAAGDQTWIVQISPDQRVEYVDLFAYVDAPREVYSMVYVYSDAARDLTLALGPDDGARTWLNGQVVSEITSCQGTNVDQFTADVALDAGWNRLVIEVYDQGGGWGNYVRFYDGGSPVTDLELSLSPGGSWDFDQTDSDGDGVGDACDTSPGG